MLLMRVMAWELLVPNPAPFCTRSLTMGENNVRDGVVAVATMVAVDLMPLL